MIKPIFVKPVLYGSNKDIAVVKYNPDKISANEVSKAMKTLVEALDISSIVALPFGMELEFGNVDEIAELLENIKQRKAEISNGE